MPNKSIFAAVFKATHNGDTRTPLMHFRRHNSLADMGVQGGGFTGGMFGLGGEAEQRQGTLKEKREVLDAIGRMLRPANEISHGISHGNLVDFVIQHSLRPLDTEHKITEPNKENFNRNPAFTSSGHTDVNNTFIFGQPKLLRTDENEITGG